jgi:putative glutathione S-transferase
MGQMIEGVWQPGWYAPDARGAFRRPRTRFHGHICPEAGRYHLFASYACPWAQRALITRSVRGLEDAIGVTIVDPRMGDDGWAFPEGVTEPVMGAKLLAEIYLRANARYTGRVTVPVLWDLRAGTIVNNESREVMRMLDVDMAPFATRAGSLLAPPELVGRIDETLDAIYGPINDGVYRAGFATTQHAYERACAELFAALDGWEAVLARQRFTCGDVMTEADVALFTTLLRFDLVYYAHFKCNLRRVQDYPNLWGFVRDVYQVPEVKATCRLDHIKVHYYWSQTTVNPHRIVPLGPTIDLDAPHDRARLTATAAPRGREGSPAPPPSSARGPRPSTRGARPAAR